jgi:protein-disulfide isomerase
MMDRMPQRPWPIVGAIVLAACSSSAQSPHLIAPGDIVATVGSSPITAAQMDERALQQPATGFGNVKLSQALYEARRAALDDLVANLLLDQEAKARGVERTVLIEREITAKVPDVTEGEIAAFYGANQARMQGGSLDQMRPAIKNYLTQQRMQTVREQFLDTLRAKTPVRVSLEPPRLAIATANSPSRGPSAAPVEIVEFSDFQCPFCLRAHPTVDQLLKDYGTRVRFVYRHYPLPGHPNARPAAEAAECAAEQGKFWPYYDKLFATQSKLADADLKQDAVELGMDGTKFNACVDSHKYAPKVETDIRAGQEAGVDGTPAFFINGRLVSGAQPYDIFKKMIDEELQLKRAQ